MFQASVREPFKWFHLEKCLRLKEVSAQYFSSKRHTEYTFLILISNPINHLMTLQMYLGGTTGHTQTLYKPVYVQLQQSNVSYVLIHQYLKYYIS